MNEFEPTGLGLTISSIEERAWAAGFFDGEGCITLDKRGNIRPTITIAQVNREPLDRFCSAVGVGKVFGPYDVYTIRKDFGNAKPQYKYQAGGIDNVRRINQLLSPYLSAEKGTRLAQMVENSKHVIGRVRVNG